MMRNNKYILLRHGQTKYQANGSDALYFTEEQFSLPITKQGEKDIKRVAKELKKKNIDLIYCSDFYRTKQTAEIVAKELGLDIIFDERLRDTNFGVFNGKTGEEYRSFFDFKKQRYFKRPPEGENWRDVSGRTAAVIKDIEKKYENKTILIISHADPLWLVAGYLMGLNEDEMLEKRSPEGIWPDVGQCFEIDNYDNNHNNY